MRWLSLVRALNNNYVLIICWKTQEMNLEVEYLHCLAAAIKWIEEEMVCAKELKRQKSIVREMIMARLVRVVCD